MIEGMIIKLDVRLPCTFG